MTRKSWTRADINSGCGYGDQILATTNDPTVSWYWREVNEWRGVYNFEFVPKPGRLVYDATIGAMADVEDAVLIEPHVKQTFSADNRDWGFERWQQLVDSVPLRFVQCLYGQPELKRVDVIHTVSFAHACSVLAASRGIVTSASGLSHAAGALGKPAVVIFGGFAPPSVLGYPCHHNIDEPDPDALGWRKSHPSCRAALERISVERVARAVEEVFGDWS